MSSILSQEYKADRHTTIPPEVEICETQEVSKMMRNKCFLFLGSNIPEWLITLWFTLVKRPKQAFVTLLILSFLPDF